MEFEQSTTETDAHVFVARSSGSRWRRERLGFGWHDGCPLRRPRGVSGRPEARLGGRTDRRKAERRRRPGVLKVLSGYRRTGWGGHERGFLEERGREATVGSSLGTGCAGAVQTQELRTGSHAS